MPGIYDSMNSLAQMGTVPNISGAGLGIAGSAEAAGSATGMMKTGGGNAGLYGMAAQLGSTAITAVDMKDGKMSKGGGAAAGALSGAATGLAIGSVVPVIGNAVGAAVGAVVGGISGFVKAKKNEEEAEKADNLAKWNAARSSKPNPASIDLSSSQYGRTDMSLPGSKDTYLQNKFQMQDTGILGKINSFN